MLLSTHQYIHNHKVSARPALRGARTIIIHSYFESHNLYLFSPRLTSHLSGGSMYISKLSKLNLILMISSHGLYDMLTFLLFRLCVISLIFHPPLFFFFNFIFTHLLKVKTVLEKRVHQQGAQQPHLRNQAR